MNFLKQAAGLAQSNKSEESSSAAGGKSGLGDLSGFMHQAEGFLGHKKETPVGEGQTKVEEGKADGEEVKEDVKPVKALTHSSDEKHSYSELYGDAQTLYAGLQNKLAGKQVDEQKLKDSAQDLVEGAESLGLLKPGGALSGYFKKGDGVSHDQSPADAPPVSKPSKEESA